MASKQGFFFSVTNEAILLAEQLCRSSAHYYVVDKEGPGYLTGITTGILILTLSVYTMCVVLILLSIKPVILGCSETDILFLFFIIISPLARVRVKTQGVEETKKILLSRNDDKRTGFKKGRSRFLTFN